MKSKEKLLVVKCLKDDDDGSMDKMSRIVAKAKEKEGYDVTVVDFENIKTIIGSKNFFNTVCFCGHSSFYDRKEALVPKSPPDRKIGGYTTKEIVNSLYDLVMGCKAKNLDFSACCETALSRHTNDILPNKGCNNLILERAIGNAVLVSADLCVKKKKYEEVSTVVYLLSLLRKQLKPKGFHAELKIVGSNGASLIVEGKPVRSFDSTLPFYNKYNNLLKERFTTKKIKNPTAKKGEINRISKKIDQLIIKDVDNKENRYHTLGYTLNI